MRFINSVIVSFVTACCYWLGRASCSQPSMDPAHRPLDPSFVEHVPNVTVAVGREASLTCQVRDLGNYMVGWIKAGDQTILTLHKRVITHNSRIHVTHDEHRTWVLHIKQVQEADQGCYMCQINTASMMKQLGCLNVLVPPDIATEDTSSDVTVTEGHNVSLSCRASGQPTPVVTWRREDGKRFTIKEGRTKKQLDVFRGDHLHLHKIRRTDMGAFMCIATNDVPPAVSKRIMLNVNFPPSVKVRDQLVGCPVGESVRLECFVEAFPNAINYWIRDTGKKYEGINDGEMLLDGPNIKIEERKTSYKVHLILTLHRFAKSDIGTYTCISTNSLGRNEGKIRLYEIQRQTESPWTTKSQTTTVVQLQTPKYFSPDWRDSYSDVDKTNSYISEGENTSLKKKKKHNTIVRPEDLLRNERMLYNFAPSLAPKWILFWIVAMLC